MLRIYESRSKDARAQAFEALLRPHVAALYRAAYRFTGSAADAEDLVQDVLVKVYGKVTKLQEIANLRPWLLRVLYREFVDSRRRTRRRVLHETESALDTSNATGDTGVPVDEPESALDRDRLAASLDGVLRRLNPEQRALVTLHLLDGYTLEEVSEILDAPLGTIKSRIHRARAELRQLLAMEPFSGAKRV